MNITDGMGINIEKGHIVVCFGSHIDGIVMTKAEALLFADAVKAHAELLHDEVGEAD